ncbi:DUF4158 domain-containing protein [Streptomyces niveus]
MDGDWNLVANKTGPTRLGFCLMLKFFEMEGRFPEFIEEFPQPAVGYVAGLVKVPATELAKYDLAGAKRHRKQIREALKFRPATLDDEERLTSVAGGGGVPGRAGGGPAAGGPAGRVPGEEDRAAGPDPDREGTGRRPQPVGEGVLRPDHRAPGRCRRGPAACTGRGGQRGRCRPAGHAQA